MPSEFPFDVLSEHPTHFVLRRKSDGTTLPIAKAHLRPEMVRHVQSFATGGDVADEAVDPIEDQPDVDPKAFRAVVNDKTPPHGALPLYYAQQQEMDPAKDPRQALQDEVNARYVHAPTPRGDRTREPKKAHRRADADTRALGDTVPDAGEEGFQELPDAGVEGFRDLPDGGEELPIVDPQTDPTQALGDTVPPPPPAAVGSGRGDLPNVPAQPPLPPWGGALPMTDAAADREARGLPPALTETVASPVGAMRGDFTNTNTGANSLAARQAAADAAFMATPEYRAKMRASEEASGIRAPTAPTEPAPPAPSTEAPAPSPAPPPTAPPSLPPLDLAAEDAIQKAGDEKNAAVGAEARAVGAADDAKTDVLNEVVAKKASAEARQAELERRYNENVQRADDLSKQIASGELKPNRLWNNMTTGGQIAATIGLALSEFGSTLTHTQNTAAELFKDAINRDMEAQKSDLGRKHTLLGYYMRQGNNLQDAIKLTRADLTDIKDAQLARALSIQGSEIAKQKGAQYIADSKRQVVVDRTTAHNNAVNTRFSEATQPLKLQADQQAVELNALKIAQAQNPAIDPKLLIPLSDGSYAVARTSKQADKAIETLHQIRGIQSMLASGLALGSTVWGSDSNAAAKILHKRLLTSLAGLELQHGSRSADLVASVIGQDPEFGAIFLPNARNVAPARALYDSLRQEEAQLISDYTMTRQRAVPVKREQ